MAPSSAPLPSDRRTAGARGGRRLAGSAARRRGTSDRTDRLGLVVIATGMGLIVAGSGLGGFLRVVMVLAVCLSADMAVRSAPPGWRALILASVGSVAAVVGGVLVITGPGATDQTVRLLGAVLALAGGCAALVSAVRWTATAVHGWRRFVPLAVALVIAYVVLLPLGVAVRATNPPRGSVDARPPADVGLSVIDATVPTADGVRLAGWYTVSTIGAAVVLVPGSGSTRSATVDHAAVLARHGYGVLLLDPRGHGQSSGQAMDFGWYGDQDVSAAVTYLTRRPDVDPGRIAVVGLSMGGEEGIGAMAADPRIRAVVADGATRRVWRDRTWLADEYGIRGRFQLGVDAITDGIADLLTDADPPMPLGDAVVASAPRPILLIAAGTEPDEISAAAALRSRSPATVSVWTVPGAGHIGALSTDPGGWDRRVSGFLSAALSGP